MKRLFQILLFFALLSGCADPEEQARILYNEAQVAERSGNAEEANEKYDEILKKYLNTEIAIKVNETLNAKAVATNILKNSRIVEVVKEKKKATIETALKLYLLDNGRYPSTKQGVQALIFKPTIEPIPRNWHSGGYLESPGDIEGVSKYTYDTTSGDFVLELF